MTKELTIKRIKDMIDSGVKGLQNIASSEGLAQEVKDDMTRRTQEGLDALKFALDYLEAH